MCWPDIFFTPFHPVDLIIGYPSTFLELFASFWTALLRCSLFLTLRLEAMQTFRT